MIITTSEYTKAISSEWSVAWVNLLGACDIGPGPFVSGNRSTDPCSINEAVVGTGQGAKEEVAAQ